MKKTLNMMLCVFMVIAMLVVTASAASAFADVDSDDYFAKPVEWAVAQNITNGTSATTFSPDDTCTKAQILTFLWRAAGSPEVAHPYSPFADVNESHYYYMACLWAYEEGMLIVNSDYFEADTPCTRASTVEYMWKYAGRPDAAAVSFSDISGGTDTAKAVYWAVRSGVTNGTSTTTFSPDNTCTRGQIVTFLHRYFVEPLDTSSLSVGGSGDDFTLVIGPEESASQSTPAPEEESDPYAAAENIPASELDPLPPPDYMDHPDWYMNLTDVDDMSDARLLAEEKNVSWYIWHGEHDYLGDAVYARQYDLWGAISGRGLETLPQY